MRQDKYWKLLILFCITFLTGMFCIDLATQLLPKEKIEKSEKSNFSHQQKIEKALNSAQKRELQCVPLDDRLEYQYIKEEKLILEPKPFAEDKKSAESNVESSEKEENKKYRAEQIKKLLKESLEKSENSLPFYDFEKYKLIEEKDLLYREVCQKN